MHDDYERGDIALGEVKKQNNVYERGDIALGDVKKQNNVYEHGDIALGDVKKQNNADYGVLPVNDGYTSLPSGNDGYDVLSKWNQQPPRVC